MLTPPLSGSRTTAEKHLTGKGDLSGYGREECENSDVVKAKDTGTGGGATAHKMISTPEINTLGV